MNQRLQGHRPSDARLRDVTMRDIDQFFSHQLDEEAIRMAAFTAKDPANEQMFRAHWEKIMSTPDMIKKTVLYDGQVAGHVMVYPQDGHLEVTYWIGREYWGRGIATAALSQLLALVKARPLYARAAKDNLASLRVLQKCGFVVVGEDRGFANGRNAEVEEFILQLDTRVDAE